MVRAVNGMTEESSSVYVTFVVMMILFQSTCISTFFEIMDYGAAIVCFILMIIGSYYWYVYCLRIYNRFRVSVYYKINYLLYITLNDTNIYI